MKENNITLLRATFFISSSGKPWDPGYSSTDYNYRIEKNIDSSKYYFIDSGLDCTPWYKEFVFNTLDEAFDRFFSYKKSMYFFEIEKLDESLKYLYTKKLLEKLNSNQFDSIEKLPIDSFRNHLKIELKLIKNANEKNIRIIKLSNSNSITKLKNSFLVGKLSVEGNMLVIKDEKDQILFITSSENLIVESEEIITEYYWYFK